VGGTAAADRGPDHARRRGRV